MNNNETIDNFLYDEENEYTQANDLWEEFFAEREDEIDERPWVQADGLSHRHDLNRQIGDMLRRVLTEDEEELILRLADKFIQFPLNNVEAFLPFKDCG